MVVPAAVLLCRVIRKRQHVCYQINQLNNQLINSGTSACDFSCREVDECNQDKEGPLYACTDWKWFIIGAIVIVLYV